MSGFVPGRDQVTLGALAPEDRRQAEFVEAAAHRAVLDKEELAELEHEQTGSAAPKRKRTLIDRLLRRA
jgi:hypothetical protein